MKKYIKQKLKNLASGELIAVTAFWADFFLYKRWIPTTKALISISFSLLILSLILIQGSVFWWILIKRISNPGFALKHTGRIYRRLKAFDMFLLGIGFLVILFNYSNFPTMLISFAIWIFAGIEWVNYFILQLSYSINPMVLLRYILHGKLRKSKIAKEIEKAI